VFGRLRGITKTIYYLFPKILYNLVVNYKQNLDRHFRIFVIL